MNSYDNSVNSLLQLEVTRGRLQSIVDEAAATVIRTAFSVVMTEAKDFACGILLPSCRTVVQSQQSIPVFLSTMTRTAEHLISMFPLSEWQEGDIYATNDPWMGTGHLYDITLVSPVMVDGEIIALAAVVGHLPDIGGRIVGTDATQVFEEGLRIPPVRLARNGVPDPVIVRILEANVRMPDQVVGDLNALITAGTVTQLRLAAFVKRLGRDVYFASCGKLEQLVRNALRTQIGAIPQGDYRAHINSEGIGGTPFDIYLRLTVADRRIVASFQGSSAQLPAGINSCLNYTSSYVVGAIKSLLIPQLPFNHGVLDVIDVSAPEGSIVNSRFPAAGAARNVVGHFVPGLVLQALAAALPDGAIADCGAPRPSARINGLNPRTGKVVTAPVFVPGGFGARAEIDGLPCVSFPTNGSTVPIEMLEGESALLFEAKEMIVDSGGAGRRRGGLGQRVTFVATADEQRASVVVQRLKSAPQGVFGGNDGALARVLINGVDLQSPTGRVVLARGDRITIESPGGGGYGDPRKREHALVADDLLDGYISMASAENVYGYDAKTVVKRGR